MGVLKSAVWGMSVPWTLAVSAALGIWPMFSPAVFGTEKPAADVLHLGGALVVVVAGICMAEVVRIGRYLNVVLGVGIALLPWILGGATWMALLHATFAGLLVAALALPRGPKLESYGMWDRWVR